jgi:hypothetical protein
MAVILVAERSTTCSMSSRADCCAPPGLRSERWLSFLVVGWWWRRRVARRPPKNPQIKTTPVHGIITRINLLSGRLRVRQIRPDRLALRAIRAPQRGRPDQVPRFGLGQRPAPRDDVVQLGAVLVHGLAGRLEPDLVPGRGHKPRPGRYPCERGSARRTGAPVLPRRYRSSAPGGAAGVLRSPYGVATGQGRSHTGSGGTVRTPGASGGAARPGRRNAATGLAPPGEAPASAAAPGSLRRPGSLRARSHRGGGSVPPAPRRCGAPEPRPTG